VAFTYDPTLDTDLDKVRFYAGDTVYLDGPLPDGGNFSNEEITALLTIHAEWECALAACFEKLASAWASRPIFGPGELSTIHVDTGKKYERLAEVWRGRCLEASAGGGLGYAEILDASGAGTGEAYEPIFQREEFGLGTEAR
jgi:hypothetical protein